MNQEQEHRFNALKKEILSDMMEGMKGHKMMHEKCMKSQFCRGYSKDHITILKHIESTLKFWLMLKPTN